MFFTYGKKTIFLCGIDKKAIREAVLNKYGDIVKSNEYLEKIFDISFSMPTTINNSKLISQYFENDEKVGDEKLSDLITNFFEELHFKNPRRIKKILNKYLIIKRLKDNEENEDLILPNIIFKNKGSLFETFLTLYLLIIKEFQNEIFSKLLNLNFKRAMFEKALTKYYVETKKVDEGYRFLCEYLSFEILEKSFSEFNHDKINYYSIIAFLSPNEIESMSYYVFDEQKHFRTDLNLINKKIDFYFCEFLFSYEKSFNEEEFLSDFSINDYKKMISNLI